MATPQLTHDHEHHQHRSHSPLPPSPPPSPPTTRRRRKKETDPFFNISASNTPLSSPSPPSSPTASPKEPKEPLLTRIIISPILFISFLVSLSLVNWRDRVRRKTRHRNRNRFLTYLSPSTWVAPEPYQDPGDTTWGRRDSNAGGHVEPPGVLKNVEKRDKRTGSWFLHKKIRKVTRLEVSDALELRGRVIVAMVLVLLLLLCGTAFGVGWLLRSWWG